jgi:glucose-1-phosphate thymidylyltransferase
VRGTVEDGADVTGRVDLAPSAVIRAEAVVRGPVSIGAESVIESGSYVGPYTSIGPSSTIAGARVENSVLVGETSVETHGTLVDSLVGRAVTIDSGSELRPEGHRLVVGENSTLRL